METKQLSWQSALKQRCVKANAVLKHEYLNYTILNFIYKMSKIQLDMKLMQPNGNKMFIIFLKYKCTKII